MRLGSARRCPPAADPEEVHKLERAADDRPRKRPTGQRPKRKGRLVGRGRGARAPAPNEPGVSRCSAVPRCKKTPRGATTEAFRPETGPILPYEAGREDATTLDAGQESGEEQTPMSNPLHAAYYADRALQRTVVDCRERPGGARHVPRALRVPADRPPRLPGQFLMLRLAGGNDPLLGRPLALYDTVRPPPARPGASTSSTW